MMQTVILGLVVINLLTFFLYGVDKWKARHQRW